MLLKQKLLFQFENSNYFTYTFPQPQYLGAKYKFLNWLKNFIPNNVKVTFDAFSGSQSVAYFFKQMGFEVITNDFLNFNHQIGLGLIENKQNIITEKDLNILFQTNKQTKNIILDNYKDLFFTEEECIFLDQFRENINLIENKYTKALIFTVINRSLTRKVTMGHFGHTQALVYANNPERIKRNRNLIRPIKDIFLELIPTYNEAVFDNKQNNKSYNYNILDLLPNLQKENIDLIYLDPPYCDSHADYQSFYHLLETFTEYWSHKEFVNSIKRYNPQRWSGFDKKSDIINSLNILLEQTAHIPYMLISWNNRSYPSIKDFQEIISKYRTVKVYDYTYQNSVGGKGSVKGSKEVLFICDKH